ncbi:hypothetical protein DACRYDRAFT_19763 [Dacryopinax primogenitus]|uniref:Chromo domain-containing protein n=1 Tax=Dacryopinax primogenitus (strain DJM 731) TaxID=1858805 RepID=M5G4M0_DACPD|nr:uncharacterized protein DACRYDRAFT_19763 [Dacryopinax primogenitus]EJU05186.1 hypothetical protein DACRYDRAFT_19763 [Dacryopinax primogenitus]
MPVDEEYVIEYISQARVVEDGEGGKEWVYKVHWVGFPEDQASHEHDNGFFPDPLKDFWEATGKSNNCHEYEPGAIVKPSPEYIGKAHLPSVLPSILVSCGIDARAKVPTQETTIASVPS